MALSKSQFENKANASFRKFADELKASEDYLDQGIQLCEQVRKLLERELSRWSRGAYSIAATYYGGSIGKHTELEQPDFDIVMKINNRQPPFTDLLNFFEHTFKNNSAHLKILPQTIRLTRFSVQFSFINGMQVDLLLAVSNLTEDQVLEKMKKNSRNRRYYSSSLVEKQVEFMKNQGAFAHAVVRLAKYWYKSMDLGGVYISGGSTIFELLAVAAVIQQRGQPESMINAFLRVIEYVSNFDRLGLSFQHTLVYGYGDWVWTIQEGIGGRMPYLMEPSNPINNLLQGMKPRVIEGFKVLGRAMQTRMARLINRQEYCSRVDANQEVVIDFDKLFNF